MRIENTEEIARKLAEFGILRPGEFDLPDDLLEAARHDCAQQFRHVSAEEREAIAVARVAATLERAAAVMVPKEVAEAPSADSPSLAMSVAPDFAPLVRIGRLALRWLRVIAAILALLLVAVAARAQDNSLRLEVLQGGTRQKLWAAGTARLNCSTGLTCSFDSGTGRINITAGGGTPGGSNTQLQYNNGGAFGGISGATSDGTNATFGSGNLLATLPRITTGINDANGNSMFAFTPTGSAVNYFTFANAATGNNPTVSATGSDSDIGISFRTKGSGKYIGFGLTYDAVQVGDAGFGNTGEVTINSSLNNAKMKIQGAFGFSLASDMKIGFIPDTGFVGNLVDTAIARGGVSVLRATDGSTGGGIWEFPQVASGGTPASNSARIYSKDVSGTAEMFALDESGNETQISPHEPGTDKWVFYSCNEKTQRCIKVDMDRLVTLVEKLSGEKVSKRWRYPALRGNWKAPR